jgi:two-component system sensor histidine kinase FlrB
METFSHLEPINQQINSHGRDGHPEAGLLAEAFTKFISASARLESSYGQLQLEITFLSRELADRNSALKLSLAENERVHRALQQTVDSMPCGVLVVEEDGSVSVINPEGRRLLDISHLPAQHLDSISLASGIDLAGFLNDQVSADEEREFCKTTLTSRRWLAVRERRLLHSGQDGEREKSQVILILRDITLQKQAEEERERARKATALAEVATTLAHEIRNPLASLELFTGLISAGGEDTAEWISHLHAGIRSLAATVSNVLSFHGREVPSLLPIDLNAAIRSSVEFARPIAQQAGVNLSFDAEDAGLWIQGNASALQQVVLNMVCNSLRHTPLGGSVWVTVNRDHDGAGRENGVAVIEFSDTGCGIAAEDLPEIFKAGYSVGGSSSGLGLAVCTQIVQQHEGTIRVTSARGIGTTFFVEIPAL